MNLERIKDDFLHNEQSENVVGDIVAEIEQFMHVKLTKIETLEPML